MILTNPSTIGQFEELKTRVTPTDRQSGYFCSILGILPDQDRYTTPTEYPRLLVCPFQKNLQADAKEVGDRYNLSENPAYINITVGRPPLGGDGYRY